MLTELVKKFENNFGLKNGDDPLESAKRMVNNIQAVVGIRNVFGDKKIKRYTLTSVLLLIIFPGGFLYMAQLSQFAHLIQVLPNKAKSFQAMNCYSSTWVPLSKFIFMWFSSDRLKTITDLSRQGMQTLPPGSAQNAMRQVLQKARLVSWLVILNQVLTHFLYLFLPLFMTIINNKRYLPTTPGHIFGFPPLKYVSPYYEMSFMVIIFSSVFSAANQTGYIVLFVTLLSHELGHFNAICETLNDVHKIIEANDKRKPNTIDIGTSDDQIIDETEPLPLKNEIDKEKQIEKMLKFCVKHHQFIFRLHEKICQLYKAIFGAHFLIMVIVLVTTLQTLNSWGLINTLLTGVTGIMPLMVYCFGGELLITASAEMSHAAYSCGWQGMNVNYSRIVYLILSLSQKPLYYTAAGIFIMNHETFGDVAQVVYKIYAVFN
ncbi:hypothetical protein ACJJTC_003088 [Scirpophaga incertulas]